MIHQPFLFEPQDLACWTCIDFYDVIIHLISDRAPHLSLQIRLWTWHTWENNWRLPLKNIWILSNVDSSRIGHKIKSLILSLTKLNLRTKIVDLSLNLFCSFFLLCLHNDFQTFGAYCSPKNLNIAANYKSVSIPNNHKSLKCKNPPSQILRTLSEGQVTVCRHITVDAFSSSCYLRNSEQLLPLKYILLRQPPQ